VLRYETQQALSEAIHSHGEQLQLESAGPASMQMFILLPPLFSIMFHVLDLRAAMLLRRAAKSVTQERKLPKRPWHRRDAQRG
jgi:hypothetical protein